MIAGKGVRDFKVSGQAREVERGELCLERILRRREEGRLTGARFKDQHFERCRL